MEIIHLGNEKDFKKIVVGEDKILVDFFANWCGPCKMLGTVLEKVDSDIKVLKVDTDQYEDLCRKFGIMTIPTLILFNNGKEVKRNIGFIDKDTLEDFLN